MQTTHHLNYPLKRAIRGTSAILFALILNHYFFPADFWMVVTTALLTQSELGTPIKQTWQRFLWIIMLFLATSQTLILFPSPWCAPALIILATAVSAYAYASVSRRYLSLHFPLLALMIMLLVLFIPAVSVNTTYLLEIVSGTAITIFCTLFIFPDRPDKEFSTRVLSLLPDLSAYLSALVALLLKKENARQLADTKRAAVEKVWANKDDYFPVWVFVSGYNPALRAGQYYFVIHIGQITEILFAMHHLALHSFQEPLLLEQLSLPLRASVTHTQELMANLVLLLEEKPPIPLTMDFLEDLTTLEETFRSTVNVSVELLDISQDYVYLAAFIRYLKDLRLQLLALNSTLR